MAIYRLSAKVISRKKGRSATGAAAYRAGEKIHDERDDITHDYTRKKGVVFTEILAPENVPEGTKSRSKLWNQVELGEKRVDAQVAREVEVALPREFDLEQNKGLIRGFVQKQFVDRGMVADIAIHEAKAKDGGRNPHAHILLTMREISPEGFDKKKNRDWNKKELLKEWRQSWQNHVNTNLEASGFDQKVDHRSFEDQGIEKQPGIHIGVHAANMEKQGIDTERGNRQRQIQHYNSLLAYQAAIARSMDWKHNNTWLDVEMSFDAVPEHVKARIDEIRDRMIQEHAEKQASKYGDFTPESSTGTLEEQHQKRLSTYIAAAFSRRGESQETIINRRQQQEKGFVESPKSSKDTLLEQYTQFPGSNTDKDHHGRSA